MCSFFVRKIHRFAHLLKVDCWFFMIIFSVEGVYVCAEVGVLQCEAVGDVYTLRKLTEWMPLKYPKMIGSLENVRSFQILLMEEILHQLGCLKSCKQRDELPVNGYRMSSMNRMALLGIYSKFQVGTTSFWPSLQLDIAFFSPDQDCQQTRGWHVLDATFKTP